MILKLVNKTTLNIYNKINNFKYEILYILCQ